MEFNQDGELLATGDKGGRVVIFQRDSSGSVSLLRIIIKYIYLKINKLVIIFQRDSSGSVSLSIINLILFW